MLVMASEIFTDSAASMSSQQLFILCILVFTRPTMRSRGTLMRLGELFWCLRFLDMRNTFFTFSPQIARNPPSARPTSICNSILYNILDAQEAFDEVDLLTGWQAPIDHDMCALTYLPNQAPSARRASIKYLKQLIVNIFFKVARSCGAWWREGRRRRCLRYNRCATFTIGTTFFLLEQMVQLLCKRIGIHIF